MTVVELIEWLKTQDQGATVYVPVGEAKAYHEVYHMEKFRPDLAEVLDMRGNPFVKPSDPHYESRSLHLGVIA